MALHPPAGRDPRDMLGLTGSGGTDGRVRLSIPSPLDAQLARRLQDSDAMTDREVGHLRSLWQLRLGDRWRLYRSHRPIPPHGGSPGRRGRRHGNPGTSAGSLSPHAGGPGLSPMVTPSRAGSRRWLGAYGAVLEEALARQLEEYEQSAAQLAQYQLQKDLQILRQSRVIGMTTTGGIDTAAGLGLGLVLVVVPVVAKVQFLVPVLVQLPVPVLVPTLEPVPVPVLVVVLVPSPVPVLVVLEPVPAPKGAVGGG